MSNRRFDVKNYTPRDYAPGVIPAFDFQDTTLLRFPTAEGWRSTSFAAATKEELEHVLRYVWSHREELHRLHAGAGPIYGTNYLKHASEWVARSPMIIKLFTRYAAVSPWNFPFLLSQLGEYADIVREELVRSVEAAAEAEEMAVRAEARRIAARQAREEREMQIAAARERLARQTEEARRVDEERRATARFHAAVRQAQVDGDAAERRERQRESLTEYIERMIELEQSNAAGRSASSSRTPAKQTPNQTNTDATSPRPDPNNRRLDLFD